MIVRALRAKYYAQYLLLIILFVLLRLDSWLLIYGKDWFYTYSDASLTEIVDKLNPGIISLIVSVVVLFTGILLNQLLENHRIIPLNQLIPAAIYVIMMSSSILLLPSVKIAFVNLLFVFQINLLFNTYGEVSPKGKVFDCGLLLGVITLLYPPAGWFLLFLWLALAVYQVLSFRTTIISLLGFLIPHLYAGFYYFWVGKLKEILPVYISKFTSLPPIDFDISIYLLILWSLFFILFITGYNEIIRTMVMNPIEIRRKIRVLVIFFFFSIATSVFSGDQIKYHLMIALIPLSALLSVYLTQTRKVTRAEIIMTFILITIFSEKVISWIH